MHEIKENFLRHIDNGICNGAEWKINFKNKIYHESVGFKDLNKKIFLKKNLIYRIWSMTKPIVSFATMQLIEKKYLSLNDPIDKYLPQFNKIKILEKGAKNIKDVYQSKNIPTIAQLLCHTAGFSYNSSDNVIGKEYENRKIFHSSAKSLKDEVELISELPLLFDPGSNWHYSVSIDILARILEIVTKDNLINILKENIFSPLNMHDTDFFINKKQNESLVTTFEYSKKNNTIKEPKLNIRKLINYAYPSNDTKFVRGGHGLYSTASDYSKFAHMLINGKNENGKKLIDIETLIKMRSNCLSYKILPLEITSVNTIKDQHYVNDLDGYGWGYGFRVLLNNTDQNRYGSIGEFGWSGYASTYFLVDPVNKISGVLMMQILDSERCLKQDFYNSIFKNLEKS